MQLCTAVLHSYCGRVTQEHTHTVNNKTQHEWQSTVWPRQPQWLLMVFHSKAFMVSAQAQTSINSFLKDKETLTYYKPPKH